MTKRYEEALSAFHHAMAKYNNEVREIENELTPAQERVEAAQATVEAAINAGDQNAHRAACEALREATNRLDYYTRRLAALKSNDKMSPDEVKKCLDLLQGEYNLIVGRMMEDMDDVITALYDRFEEYDIELGVLLMAQKFLYDAVLKENIPIPNPLGKPDKVRAFKEFTRKHYRETNTPDTMYYTGLLSAVLSWHETAEYYRGVEAEQKRWRDAVAAV